MPKIFPALLVLVVLLASGCLRADLRSDALKKRFIRHYSG